MNRFQKIQILIFTLLLFSHGCSCKDRKTTNKQEVEEIRIVSCIISQIRYPKPAPPPTGSQMSTINNLRENEVGKEEIIHSEKKLIVFLQDSLYHLDADAMDYLEANTFNGLGNLFLDQNLTSRHLDISLVNENVRFEVVSNTKYKENTSFIENDHVFYKFSRIVFNTEINQALLFVTKYGSCPGNGTGTFYLLKLNNGHWEIVNRDMIWIE